MTRATMRGVRHALRGLAGLIALLVLAIWAASLSSGAVEFWPAWAWFGLAFPLSLDAALHRAWQRPAGPERQVAMVWSFVGVVGLAEIVIWALAGLVSGAEQSFWPAWPLSVLLTIATAHSIIVLRDRWSARPRLATLAARIEALSRARRQTADAQAAELKRIERDLHDGAQARLVALSMQLGRAELQLEQQPEARRLVSDAQQEARRAIAELRELSQGIAPPLLADRGLGAAVRALAARYGADVRIESEIDRQLAPAVESAAYFVAAEALTNAAKHASARWTSIRLRRQGAELLLIVADNGRGGADPSASGLTGLRERVEALDGTLRIESIAGEGTTVEARFPSAW